MKKRLIALMAAASMAISIAGAVAGVEGEIYKKQCADIVNSGGQTVLDTITNRYDLNFSLRTPSRCTGVVYTLYVYDDAADCPTGTSLGGFPVATLSQRGTTTVNADGQGIVAFFADNVDNDGTVWVIATSSQGNTFYDRAPDVDCLDWDTTEPGKGSN